MRTTAIVGATASALAIWTASPANAITNVGADPQAGGVGVKCVVLAPVCLAKGAASGVANSAFDQLTQFVASGATWLLSQFSGLISSTTTVHLDASWYADHYRQMATIGGALALGLVFLAVCAGAVTGDPGRIVRAIVRVASAGIGTAVAIGITALLLELSDALSSYVGGGTDQSFDKAMVTLGDGLGPGAGLTPEFITLIACVAAIIIGLVLWLELLIRSVAIYTVVLFLPLALAGGGLGGSGRWLKRLVETLAALIFSKFVIVAIFALAAGAVTEGGSFSAFVMGLALLLAAAASPWALMNLIHAAESGVGNAVGAARGRSGALASGTASRIGGVGRMASFPSTSRGMTLSRSAGSGAFGAGAAAVAGGLAVAGVAAHVAKGAANAPAKHLATAGAAASGTMPGESTGAGPQTTSPSPATATHGSSSPPLPAGPPPGAAPAAAQSTPSPTGSVVAPPSPTSEIPPRPSAPPPTAASTPGQQAATSSAARTSAPQPYVGPVDPIAEATAREELLRLAGAPTARAPQAGPRSAGERRSK